MDRMHQFLYNNSLIHYFELIGGEFLALKGEWVTNATEIALEQYNLKKSI